MIAGAVFIDASLDGAQQAGEPGVPGVQVTLRTVPGGSVQAQINTDGAGRYSFDSVAPGDWSVGIGLPPGTALISPASNPITLTRAGGYGPRAPVCPA